MAFCTMFAEVLRRFAETTIVRSKIHIHIHICIYIYIYMHKHVYVHTYIYIYIMSKKYCGRLVETSDVSAFYRELRGPQGILTPMKPKVISDTHICPGVLSLVKPPPPWMKHDYNKFPSHPHYHGPGMTYVLGWYI